MRPSNASDHDYSFRLWLRRRYGPRSVAAPLCRGSRSQSMTADVKQSILGWRTPLVVLICGCLISMISFGPRSALGFFLTPMSQENHWGRDVFAMALAIQNLLWGVGQPFAGAIADKYGTNKVLAFGAILYAAGIGLMGYSTTPGTLDLTAGVLIGFGLSASSFTI